MAEKELRFICSYADCGKETTVIIKGSKSSSMQGKGATRVYYCEHCNRANRISIPDNLDTYGFTLSRDRGFVRYTNDGIPLLQGEKDLFGSMQYLQSLNLLLE